MSECLQVLPKWTLSLLLKALTKTSTSKEANEIRFEVAKALRITKPPTSNCAKSLLSYNLNGLYKVLSTKFMYIYEHPFYPRLLAGYSESQSHVKLKFGLRVWMLSRIFTTSQFPHTNISFTKKIEINRSLPFLDILLDRNPTHTDHYINAFRSLSVSNVHPLKSNKFNYL